ncbi:MAG: type II toxin-antitoxin system RelB/DinJ family antitoxin [Oscillospiraceae bacterium]|jgi:DNA-damage-inducible protein J|nr:type II toxin-antitoxin system RelB/DinJ family antitoxin [Oscillospiraceae bacterium]
MARTAVINVRTEPELKAQAEEIYRGLGVSLSDAINMFICKSIDFRGLPFELRHEIPNAETIAAMKEAEDIAKGAIQSKSYASFTEMLNDALSDDTEV